MNYNEIKLSDVTKALKKAGFKAVTLDYSKLNPFPELTESGIFYKYMGNLTIQGEGISFHINSQKAVKCGWDKYATCATNADGESSEECTNCPQFFFPRLFDFLNGEITEAEIIAEICA